MATETRKVKPDPDAGFPTMPAVEFLLLRELCGTQDEVASELQTARRTLGRWERGERPVPGIAAVAIRMLAREADARRERTKAAVAAIVEADAVPASHGVLQTEGA